MGERFDVLPFKFAPRSGASSVYVILVTEKGLLSVFVSENQLVFLDVLNLSVL